MTPTDAGKTTNRARRSQIRHPFPPAGPSKTRTSPLHRWLLAVLAGLGTFLAVAAGPLAVLWASGVPLAAAAWIASLAGGLFGALVGAAHASPEGA